MVSAPTWWWASPEEQPWRWAGVAHVSGPVWAQPLGVAAWPHPSSLAPSPPSEQPLLLVHTLCRPRKASLTRSSKAFQPCNEKCISIMYSISCHCVITACQVVGNNNIYFDQILFACLVLRVLLIPVHFTSHHPKASTPSFSPVTETQAEVQEAGESWLHSGWLLPAQTVWLLGVHRLRSSAQP